MEALGKAKETEVTEMAGIRMLGMGERIKSNGVLVLI